MKSLDNIQEWLRNRIAGEINAQPESLSLQVPFANYGLDSIVIVTIVADLEEWLKVYLDPTIFWEYPTIEALSIWLLETNLSNREN